MGWQVTSGIWIGSGWKQESKTKRKEICFHSSFGIESNFHLCMHNPRRARYTFSRGRDIAAEHEAGSREHCGLSSHSCSIVIHFPVMAKLKVNEALNVCQHTISLPRPLPPRRTIGKQQIYWTKFNSNFSIAVLHFSIASRRHHSSRRMLARA